MVPKESCVRPDRASRFAVASATKAVRGASSLIDTLRNWEAEAACRHLRTSKSLPLIDYGYHS